MTQASTDAIWDYNLVDGTVWWNTAHRELFGRPADAKTVDWWSSRVLPDDRQRTSQSLRAFAAGEGFLSDAPRGQGMGLRIMRYRTGLFGGQLQVGSAPGGGTQVLCRVPHCALESN